jgi:hypothetical protein
VTRLQPVASGFEIYHTTSERLTRMFPLGRRADCWQASMISRGMLNFLFIHQNFPAQFVHVARELQRRGHNVVALAIRGHAIEGVQFVKYLPAAPGRTSELELARDFETKVARATACAAAMGKLKADGFSPDVIVAHPGWGESLFCKDIWPAARLVVYAEFFYASQGSDFGFDPEFSRDTEELRMRLRLKNTVHLHALSAADAIYAPTHWQCGQLPLEYRAKPATRSSRS